MAIYIPTHGDAERIGVTQSPQDYFDACVKLYQSELEANKDLIAPALSVLDIMDNANAGRMSAILTLEDGLIVEGKHERLEKLYELGVRLITLTWNYENCFGYPQSADKEEMKLGLKPFGIEAIRHMNELGILIDVSHLSEGGFDDVAKHSRKPFVASHSCCRALCDVGRNLTDRQLKLLGDSGGVCGVNFAPGFLEQGAGQVKLETLIRHIRHIVDKAGIGAAAFGSDFDGIPSGFEIGDCSAMPQVIAALEKEFSGSEVEKICSGNAIRLFSESMS